MADEIPYMPSITNVPAILEKIRSAGTPPKFTHDFLKSTLGFGSSNDRAIIKVLRSLGFLNADGTPTQRYNEFKGERHGTALALGLREGWADLFMADQKIHEKSASQIQGIAKTVTGTSDSVAKKIASTFKALSDKADWSDDVQSRVILPSDVPAEEQESPTEGNAGTANLGGAVDGTSGSFRLHHDIHIHLPPTTDVSVYRAIFQAIRSELR